MSNIDYYLRLMVQSDKEAKISAVNVSDQATLFESALTSGQTRKFIRIFNNSHDASGEAYYGYSSTMSPSGESMPIPVSGESFVVIPIADVSAIPLYFRASSGEVADLRVEELA